MTNSPSGRAAMTQAEFTYLERVAALAADSGLYGSGAKTKAQLLMKLIYGRDLGISLSAALSGDRHLRRQDGAVGEPHRGAARGPPALRLRDPRVDQRALRA